MRNSTPICLHLQTLMNAYHRSAQKRIFDLTFSIVVLPFALVAAVLGSILILVTTGGSFLYCQKRVGRDGKDEGRPAVPAERRVSGMQENNALQNQ